MRRWLLGLGTCLAVGATLVPRLPAVAAPVILAETWRPPMVVWTTHPGHVGFYFGPYFFSNTMSLTAFTKHFGKDERTLTDAFGLKHLYFLTRGLEVVATTSGQILSFTFYVDEGPGIQGKSFHPAIVQTDTGLGPGNTWNDVWLVQGRPQRQKTDETGDKLYVLEYHADATHDVDYFFKHQRSTDKIYKLGIYPRR